MDFVQRKWTPDISSESKMYPDSVYIYDGGNFVGMLTQKGDTKRWTGYTVVSREKTQDTIEEILELAHEYSVPMRFFSIERYPAQIESSTIWIPGWKIQWKFHEAAKQSDLQLPQPQTSSLPVPVKLHKNPVQRQPSLLPHPSHSSPSSQHLPKSPSEKQGRSQHFLQNKNNTASKPKASPSSNPTSRETQKQLTPTMSGELLSPSSQVGHISPLLPQHQLSQPSPCPPPPSGPGEYNQRSTSSSPNHSNLKRHLSSQQARRPHGGKSQRPTFSQMSSHE